MSNSESLDTAILLKKMGRYYRIRHKCCKTLRSNGDGLRGKKRKKGGGYLYPI